MQDTTVNTVLPNKKIELRTHPLFKRLLDEFHFEEYTKDNFNDFLQHDGFGMIIFLDDPNRMKESLDQLVIAPELLKTYHMIKNRAVIIPPSARIVANKYGFRKWPAIVMLRDGKYLGVIAGLKEWKEASEEMNKILASEPTRPPTIGIPLNAAK